MKNFEKKISPLRFASVEMTIDARILDKIQKEKIKLPVDSKGNPDWQFMEDYIKSLPYSACL